MITQKLNPILAGARRHWWLGVLAVLFLAFLGTRGLNEPDEGRYAEIAREMALGNDWLVPTLNGFPHFQKPPLIYWCTAAAMRALGVNEWAARLPSAMAGFGTVVLTYFIGRHLFGEKAGRQAALILASSVEFFLLARLATPDMLMAFWILAALAAFVGERRWLFFVAMGLGFMTKGPMALVVPLCAVIPWEIAARGTPEARRLPWIRGLAVTLLIALSWFAVLAAREPALMDYFVRYELLERFTSQVHGRHQPLWYYGPVLLLGFFPWSLLGWRVWSTGWQWVRSHPLAPRHFLLAGWICLPLIVLTLSGSKLLTYVLPLLPAFALTLGVGFARVNSRIPQWAAPVALAVWVAFFAGSPWLEHRLGRQSSVRHLAHLAEMAPDAVDATFFTCGARVHGLEFYLRREVVTTRQDADIVLPLDAFDAGRVLKNPKAMEKRFTPGHGKSERAIGIIEHGLYEKIFQAKEWRVIGAAGDFLLISNAPVWREAGGQ